MTELYGPITRVRFARGTLDIQRFFGGFLLIARDLVGHIVAEEARDDLTGRDIAAFALRAGLLRRAK
jgi:hypothetical protein